VTLVDDEKVIDIETKLAHQEHLLSALDNALSNQQSQISALEHLCQSLVERIRVLSEAGGGNGDDDERPPHY
jgi:SlyX protein